MDACIEVDGRVGERRGNIYLKKDIRMGSYKTIIRDYVT